MGNVNIDVDAKIDHISHKVRLYDNTIIAELHLGGLRIRLFIDKDQAPAFEQKIGSFAMAIGDAEQKRDAMMLEVK